MEVRFTWQPGTRGLLSCALNPTLQLLALMGSNMRCNPWRPMGCSSLPCTTAPGLSLPFLASHGLLLTFDGHCPVLAGKACWSRWVNICSNYDENCENWDSIMHRKQERVIVRSSICSTFCLLLFIRMLKSTLVWISIRSGPAVLQNLHCSVCGGRHLSWWWLVDILKYWFKLCICICVYAVANTWVGGGSMIYWPTEAPLSSNWLELLTVAPHAKMVIKGYPPTFADILTNSPNWGANVFRSRSKSMCPFMQMIIKDSTLFIW